MKRLFALALVAALTSFLADGARLSIRDSYAKPPDWAPAHGYRRKHKDREDDRKKDNDEDWREKIEDKLEERFPGYKLFTRLDENRDSRISREEWNEGDSLFSKLDRNNDGYLSRSEYGRAEEERGLIGNLLAKVKESVSSFWDNLF